MIRCSLIATLDTKTWKDAAHASLPRLPRYFRQRVSSLLNFEVVDFTDDEWIQVYDWASELPGWDLTPSQEETPVRPITFRHR